MNATSEISLAAMISHPHWSHVRGLAAADQDVQITAAHLIRDVGSTLAAGPGSLLAVMYSADRDDWRLDSLLNRAHAIGVAAVMIEGDAPVRRSTHALADRLKLPVLGSPDTIGSYQALSQMLAKPGITTADLVLRVLTAGRRAGPSVDAALEAISAALGRPTALVDTHGTLLGGVLDCDVEALAAALARENTQDSRAREVGLPDGALAIVCPVHSAGTSAWITALIPRQLPAESHAIESALTAASAALEQRLAAERLHLERDARQRASLLAEIVQGSISDSSRRRALDLGWQLDGWHTGIRIGVAPGVDLAGRRSEVVRTLAAAGLDAVVVEHGDGFAAWLSYPQEPLAKQVQDLAAALRRAQHHLFTTLGTHMGVGRVHTGPEGIGQSLSEASDAARLARSRPESGRFLHVDRLGLAQLLLAWTRTDTFQPAAHALLAPLQGQPGDLVKTLAAYLDSESSLADTAAILGIHRNTVSARITRIESLLGVDLSVPDDRLALHLACRTSMTT
jgi:sugar diacid utilization regulator